MPGLDPNQELLGLSVYFQYRHKDGEPYEKTFFSSRHSACDR